jgi:hypothetical protein
LNLSLEASRFQSKSKLASSASTSAIAAARPSPADNPSVPNTARAGQPRRTSISAERGVTSSCATTRGRSSSPGSTPAASTMRRNVKGRTSARSPPSMAPGFTCALTARIVSAIAIGAFAKMQASTSLGSPPKHITKSEDFPLVSAREAMILRV